MVRDRKFENEAELVAAFCAEVERLNEVWAGRMPDRSRWVAYHEACGWDLVLVDQHGVQIGIEAKLSLNAKVLSQALPKSDWLKDGPHYRAVLVPQNGLQQNMTPIAAALGISVIRMGGYFNGRRFTDDFSPSTLADENDGAFTLRHWHPWLPEKPLTLPDYIPDVTGGKAAPVQLTQWKVKAIKLMIILQRRGYVTRADMRFLDLSPTRFTQPIYGFLAPAKEKGGWVAWSNTPDLKAQHPRNWSEIEADWEKWAPKEA